MSGGIRCNLAEADKDRIWAGFCGDLMPEEEDRIEALFHPHLLYCSITRSRRACYCEACKRSFEVTKASASYLWRGKHGAPTICPQCGANVELICDGRIRTGASLEESKCVMVLRADPDGALRIYAGVVTRKYIREDYFDDWNDVLRRELQPYFQFDEGKRYYLAPWGRMCWTQSWWNYFGHRGPTLAGWKERHTIVQAFTPAQFGYSLAGVYDGQCNVIGAEHIQESYAKYSQAVDYIYGGGQPDDTMRVYGLEQYLAAYLEYPQLEFAVKLGEEQAVSDLVFRGVKNHRIINWKAKNPADFYRMDKQQFRRFVAAGGKIEDLILAKELAAAVEDVLTANQEMGRGFARELISCAGKAQITITQAANYISKQRGNKITALREWKDYLDMAEKLAFDLTSREFSTPKNLIVAHDSAAERLQVETDKALYQGYRRHRYPALRKKYEMEYAGMLIRVPQNSVEICTEGKVLEHCVGGYAKRHMEGKTVILFLRRADDPNIPLVTIEMNEDGNTIRQIHGWHNEMKMVNGVYPDSPRKTYAEFLDVWLSWLAAGSPRTSTGNPIYKVKMNQEVQSA
jgi:hypothetical protein